MGNCSSTPSAAELMASVRAGDHAAISACVTQGVDIACVDENGDTALHVGVRHFKTAVFSLLLQHTSNLEETDAQGLTALHRAAVFNSEAARMLLDAGADKVAPTPSGDTPLHVAAAVSENDGDGPHLCVLLLQRGAPVNTRNMRGATPLHLAASKCVPDSVRLLLRSEADVRAVDKAGNTPLHLAASTHPMRSGDEPRIEETVRLLLCAGADPLARNSAGATPIALAHTSGAHGILADVAEGGMPPTQSRLSCIRTVSWARSIGSERSSLGDTPQTAGGGGVNGTGSSFCRGGSATSFDGMSTTPPRREGSLASNASFSSMGHEGSGHGLSLVEEGGGGEEAGAEAVGGRHAPKRRLSTHSEEGDGGGAAVPGTPSRRIEAAAPAGASDGERGSSGGEESWRGGAAAKCAMEAEARGLVPPL